MKARSKRLMLVGGGVVLLVAAVALVLSAFQQNLVFFHTPSEIAAGKAPTGKTFRVGGMVEEGSIAREADGITVRFAITDTAKVIPVTYRGTLPDLFKEGKGVVAQGKLGPAARRLDRATKGAVARASASDAFGRLKPGEAWRV